MKSINWPNWGWQYGLPVLIVGGLFPLSFLMVADPDSAPLIFGMMTTSIVFLLGFIVRPRAVWVTPAAVTGVVWLVTGITYALDTLQPPAGGWLVLILPFVLIFGLPILALTSAGREVRRSFDRRFHRGAGGSAA